MKILKIGLLLLLPMAVFGQKYKTSKSEVGFFSSAPLEDITASNKSALGMFNTSNSQIAFSIPIDKFKFEKSLMEEHFNEKYMETEKFPRATFKGNLIGYKAGTPEQQVTAQGVLKIHGVEKNVEIKGTVKKKGAKLIMDAEFSVALKDYNIEVPELLFQKIAEVVEVTVYFEFEKND
ncbi:MAG: YceI family protein [Cyclobacteriaceae bacterium]|nr:YceI family protein [Cyclobacteriaceae bacterium]